MVEPTVIIAIIALCTSICHGCFAFLSKLRRSNCTDCSFEVAQSDDQVLNAINNQNEVILEQMRQGREYSKSS